MTDERLKEIKLHTIAKYNGKEYELENLLNDLLYRIDLLEIRINNAIDYVDDLDNCYIDVEKQERIIKILRGEIKW